MIFDLNKNYISHFEGSYDVCVCGGGAAGIVLALELANRGRKVALIEGGGMGYDEKSQAIYAGESIGSEYYNHLQYCRLRYLGGTTNHWAGRCMTMQPIDFEKRDYLDLSGWPIPKSDLDEYLNQTLKILDIDEKLADIKNITPLPDSSFITAWSGRSAPTRFGQKYLKELSDHPKIDLFLNVNVTDIQLDENHRHVNGIVAKGYGGRSLSFSGNNYVLSSGAIENARFLLNSDSQLPNGIGNHSDYVGRCFMEHFNVDLGRVVADLDNKIWQNGSLELFPSETLAREKEIGTGVLSISVGGEHPLHGRLKVFKEFVRDSVCRSATLTDLSQKMTHFNCPGDGVISTLIEQEPNKKSRITLSNTKDSLGLRQVQLNWQISDFDRRTIRTLGFEVAKELARLDLARVKLPEYLIEDDGNYLFGAHCHQMGTTRMAQNAKDGVVDSNCKVFGIDNLYVAGSSVFPTGGGVNPTLTIVQLSLRLAGHIAGKLSG
ncbi:MAG: GMC family oxidoreductase [Candidatus Sedimenticola sp. (ex Thyasira tokunagai)]